MHERDLNVADTHPARLEPPVSISTGGTGGIHLLSFADTARHFVLAVARNPALRGDALMPQDERLCRSARRFWSELSEEEQRVCEIFSFPQDAASKTPETAARFDGICVRFAVAAGLTGRSWILLPNYERKEEHEPKE